MEGDATPANGTASALTGDRVGIYVDPTSLPPVISKQPQSVTAAMGATATFTVEAFGREPLSYQWRRSGVDIPGATSATLTINNAGPANFGTYTVVVSNSLGTVVSQPATLIVTGLPTILYVHATSGPNASDLAIISRLESKGWQVIPKGAVASQTGDADGKVLIITSSTVSSGEVGDKFRSVAVPVLNWEAALQDNFDMTDRPGDADGVTRGVSGGQSSLNIIRADHPLAAGLSAGLQAYSTGQDASWGVPGSGATIIATIADNPNRAALYVYDKGATLFDGSKAPAARLHFPAGDNTFLALNENGLKLFDAAVKYLAGEPPQPQAAEIAITKTTDGRVRIEFTGTLQQADVVAGPYTDMVGVTSPYTTVPSAAQRFFRSRLP
jgi:hypothetical protein